MKLIEKNQDVNFMAYICTPWQIKGVEVAINNLSQQIGEKVHALVFVASHVVTGRIIDLQNCPRIDGVKWIEIEAKDFNNLGNDLNACRKIILAFQSFRCEKNVYVYCPGHINFAWLFISKHFLDKYVTYILGDDGAGGYIGYGDFGRSIFYKDIIQRFFIHKSYRMDRVIDHRLLFKQKGKYVRNEVIAEEYQSILQKGGDSLTEEIIELFSDKIVINTQCFFDNNQIDGVQDLNALQHLYDVLGENNRNVVVKPHPREKSFQRYEQFGWKVIENVTITQEEIFSKLSVKPKLIVGIHSSTLINLKALFGVKTVSLVEFYKNENITKSERKMCNRFIKLFDGFVLCPKSDKELYNIVNYVV